MLQDVEDMLTMVRWEIPTLSDVEKMARDGCADRFLPHKADVEVDSELGPYPFPGATRQQLLDHLSFLDTCHPASIQYLDKKARNLLFRIHTMHYIRSRVADIDTYHLVC